MDRTAEKSLDFKASDVKACRMCLATDIKLYSIQDTHLRSCMQSIGGLTKSCMGLPNYVCYQCAPILIKCNKLIEKSKTARTILLDILNKNGQINKPLIQEQTKSKPNLQSSLDCYLLQTYSHIQYDEDNNTSNLIKTELNPSANIKLELKNEEELLEGTFELKNENEEELLGGMSTTEILKMFKNLKEDQNDSESDVEAIEVPAPVLEISSDDEKMGDDFISLKSYNVKVNLNGVEGLAYYDAVPHYHKQKVGKTIGIAKKRKKTKIKRIVGPSDYEDSFVRRYFNINHKPTRTNKKYTCKSCRETFDYMEDARDHTIIGCQRSTGRRRRSASPVMSCLESNIAKSNQPNHWKEWPGGSKKQ